jgi:hypothetical protein
MKWWPTFWVPLVFVVVAAVLALSPFPPQIPLPPREAAPDWATDPTPVRQPRLQPEYPTAGFTYQCMDCHRIIPSPAETLRPLTQHTEIRLDHGLNTRCFNCHHPKNRNAFVDDFGQEIAWDQPQLVCAKCHGPVYRDWQAGSHGRINGYWDATRGPQTKRRCIECHDPHTPPFPRLAPAPGPNTLRMGSPEAVPHGGKRDPLRIYPRGAGAESQH